MNSIQSTVEFISLFSGAGGLDLGLERAGWHCRYAADNQPTAVETLRANQIRGFAPGAVIECRDVRELTGREILKRIGRKKGEVPLMAGGPPCQSWSSAGHQLGFEDPRGVLFRDFVRLADECGCRMIVFENVRGMLTARGPSGEPGEALEIIRMDLLSRGYHSVVSLLNAADYGIAQRRVRLVIIGYRDTAEPTFPAPTHTRPATEVEAFLPPWKTLGNILSELGEPVADQVIRPTGKMLERLRGLKPGEGIKSPGKSESTRPGGHWGYLQGGFVADPALPARTVTASSQQDWLKLPDDSYRRLCPAECAAIQSFPSTWAFAGNRAEQYRLIGNAVPPLLAEALGRELAVLAETKKKGRSSQPATLSLPESLAAAIAYTKREEKANGASRRAAPSKRRIRLAS